MKLKVCGMNHNTAAVAALKPDYLGFIFWEPSSRYFEGNIPTLPASIAKVGVFVDASVQQIIDKVNKYKLDLVQLHGKETPAFCQELKETLTWLPQEIKIIKVFSVGEAFNFDEQAGYEADCDYYLFDTKGKLPGGNSRAFDWKLLKGYPSNKPYFLAGGIGPGDVASIKEFTHRPEAEKCHALDVNSMFETRPGEKNTDAIKQFKETLALGQTH